MGQCILLGFGGVGGESFDKWAINNLLSKDEHVTARTPGSSKSEWVIENFLTTYPKEDIPAAPSPATKNALIIWASNNFIMTTS